MQCWVRVQTRVKSQTWVTSSPLKKYILRYIILYYNVLLYIILRYCTRDVAAPLIPHWFPKVAAEEEMSVLRGGEPFARRFQSLTISQPRFPNWFLNAR